MKLFYLNCGLIALAIFYGWYQNLSYLANNHDEITASLLVRIIGVVIVPIGSLFGYLG